MDQLNVKVSESVRASGLIVIRAWEAGTIKFEEVNTPTARGKRVVGGHLLGTIRTPNLIMTSDLRGRDMMIRRLLGDTTYSGIISHGEIGTSSTAAAASDTQLGAAVARQAVIFTEDHAFNQAVLQFFFPDATLTNQTYREFGCFVDGTITANSGRIFNRSIFGTPYAKSSGVDTTVEVDISLV